MSASVQENTDSSRVQARLHTDFIWWILKIILTPFFALWVRTHAVGTENIDDTRGGLLLLNHQSFLDPMVAGFRLKRPISFLAREELFRISFRWLGIAKHLCSVDQPNRISSQQHSLRSGPHASGVSCWHLPGRRTLMRRGQEVQSGLPGAGQEG